MHDPQNAEAVAEARRLGGLRRKRDTSLQLAYGFSGLANIEDMRRLLEIVAVDTLSLDNGVPRNRSVVALVMAAAKLHETGDQEERIRALEAAVLQNKDRLESNFDAPHDGSDFLTDGGSA